MKVIISVILIFSSITIEISSQNLNWQQANGPFGGYVRDLVYDSNGNMYAGTTAGIFKSTDDGENWVLSSGSMSYPYIYSMAVSPNGTIFAGTFYNKILRSTDEGNSWTQVGSNVYFIVDAMAVKQDGTVFAGVEESDGSGGGSIYRSANNGDSWTEVNSGLPDAALWQIRVDENGSVFVANIYGIYRSTNNGASWTELTNGISIIVSSDISINPINNYIYASGHSGSGNVVFRSTDGGDSFTQLTFPNNIDAHTLDVSPAGHLFLGTTQTYPSLHFGIYRSTDDGGTFVEVDSSLYAKRFAFGTSGKIFAGSNLGVHLSSDNGNSWELKVSGMNGVKVNVMAADNANNIYAGTDNGPYRSTDFSNTWELTGNSIRLRATSDMTTTINEYIFVTNDNGQVYRSTDLGENWTQLSINGFQGIIFAAPNDYLFFNSAYQPLLRSTDYGDSWTPQTSGLPVDILINDFTGNSSGIIYIATEFSGIWKSQDYGNSWSSFTNYTGYIDYVASNESGDVFWSTSSSYSNDNEFYRSTDNGSTYNQLTVVPGNTGIINDIFIGPEQNIYVAATDNNAGGVYRSTDNGDSFELVSDGLTEKQFTSLCMDSQDHLLAGTIRGVFRTMEAVPVELSSFTATLSGSEVVLDWTTAAETNNKGFEIERQRAECIGHSKNTEWEKIGFLKGSGTNTEGHSYSFIDKEITEGKYYYRLKQVDFNGSYKYSREVEVSADVPVRYLLEQNYPNPFNPATTINYQLPQNGFVTIKIYDVLGKEVATLVNELKKQGRYKLNFNASGFASGIYICQLRVNNYLSSRKMLLLK